MKRRAFAAALMIMMAAGSSSAAAEAVTLRYKWTQGDVLTYRTVVRTNSTIAGGPGGSASFEQTLSQTLKITVLTIGPDGSATLRQVIDAVSMDVNGPGGRIVYDSARPPADDADPRVRAMAKSLGAMVGEPISVLLAPDGAVRRIDGASRLVQKLMADLPSDPMAGGLAQNIKAMLSDDALRSSLEQSFARMPQSAVAPGDTWTTEQAVGPDASGRIVGASTFTLKAIEGSGEAAVARIAIKLALSQRDAPPPGSSMRMTLGEGKGEGELLFNIARGRIEQNGMRTDITSAATMRAPDGTTSSRQSTTRTSMTMQLVKPAGG